MQNELTATAKEARRATTADDERMRRISSVVSVKVDVCCEQSLPELTKKRCEKVGSAMDTTSMYSVSADRSVFVTSVSVPPWDGGGTFKKEYSKMLG